MLSRCFSRFLLMALFLAGCSIPTSMAPTSSSASLPSESTLPSSPSPVYTANATTIRLGYQPTVVFAPIYVGIERGYFAEAGVNVALEPIQATQDAIVQLGAGNFEVAVAGANAGVFNALQRGLKFRIVAPVHSEKPPVSTPLVISAKRTGEIKSIADLKGKTIGIVAPGAAIEYWVAQALAKDNLTINDITLKAMPFPNMPAALEQGSLDAAVLTEPLVTINKDKGLLAVLSGDFINGFTATYVFMNQDWMDKNPEAALGFMKGYLHATRDLQGNYMNAEIAAIIEKYTKVPATVVQRAATSQYSADGTVPLQDLEALQAFFMQRGLLTYKEPLDLKGFVDSKLAGEAMQ